MDSVVIMDLIFIFMVWLSSIIMWLCWILHQSTLVKGHLSDQAYVWRVPDMLFIHLKEDMYLQVHRLLLEENVWLGANVTVVGGVTIGAGSVVTQDIPAGVIAAGVPCKIIREITDDDIFEDMN